MRFYLPDKFQHCLGSYCLSKAIGPAPALLLGLGKEFRDQVGGVGFSYRDLIANGLGVLAAEVSGPIGFFPLYKPFKHSIYFSVILKLR